MKNLKTYRMFESVMGLTPEQVQWLDKCTKGTWTLNPQTGLVDVKGDFNCYGQGLTDFKGVKFGEVKLGFYCGNNDLTSLVGAPQEVGGRFYCNLNRLDSLEGAPLRVGGDFDCRNNHLISLEGAPQVIRGYFNCADNQLTSLEGAPHKVDGYFVCYNNPVTGITLKTIFDKMQQVTSYLAAVESLWSEIPQEDQVLLYADDFKWVTPEQGRGLVALRSYHDLRGML